MKLVIVETPAQAKILTDALGDGWRVEPCDGFVRDLPTDKLGIDVDDDFRPTFAVVPGKGNLVRRLMKAIRESEAVYAATPPTLAGEAMAWQALALSPDAKDKPIYRVTLPALTPDTIRAAFATPRPLDIHLVEAEVTHRIINRVIGWSVSAGVRKAVGVKMALTHNGMVALRLVAAHEARIAAQPPETRWHASVTFERDGTSFTAQVLNGKGAPLALRNAEQAAQLETLLKQGMFWVDGTGQALKAHPAPDALTPPMLIELAERDLALSPERVLTLVETLYEAGWITHPDSTPLTEVSTAAQAYIRREFGMDYAVPDVVVSSGIAPTDISRVPEDLPSDGAALYSLVWKYFIAAHMPPAQERIMAARILVGSTAGNSYPLELRATAKLLYADGWRRILPSTVKDEVLPFLRQGDELHPAQIAVDVVSSDATSGYTAASLIRALAQLGTDEDTVVRAFDTLCAAEAVVVADGKLALTESGVVLAAYLTSTFNELTSPNYAAELITEINRIAAGERSRIDVLHAFWSRFGAALRPTSSPSPLTVGEHKPVVLRPAEEV
ncbi:MAG: DNA topoisomerase 1 [Chloroflexota bacterium]|nr:MAG: DNA topoisomerase 1 [Chloroflexota bacterium]